MTAFRFLALVEIGIDVGVLMLLLKVLSDEEIDFRLALLPAGLTSVGATFLVTQGAALIGPLGVIAAVIIGVFLIGVVVSTLFDIDIVRSFLLAAILVLVHIGVDQVLGRMLRA
jgi:hypothetical protein